MIGLMISLLTLAGASTATKMVQVTIVNDRMKYNGDIWNTTVDVPIPGKSAELSLPSAVLLDLTGAKGIDVDEITCTPTWLTSAGEVTGTSFGVGQLSRVVKGSIGLHLVECVASNPSQQS